MILGVDFDNTLVCYDGLFHAAAVACGLMPGDGPRDKDGVRDWLIERGRGEDFTFLQGEVYGSGMRAASAYSGALECLREMIAKGCKVYIVSHKTERPVLGPAYDLRKAAFGWLEAGGFFSSGMLRREDVFFESTMADKAARIGALGCTHFIDDMKRFLERDDFPEGAGRLWFHPQDLPDTDGSGLVAYSSWKEIAAVLLESMRNG